MEKVAALSMSMMLQKRRSSGLLGMDTQKKLEKALVSYGRCSLDWQHPIDGWTSLSVAVCYGHVEAAKALLAGGANINAKDVSTGHSPLATAVIEGVVLPTMQPTFGMRHEYNGREPTKCVSHCYKSGDHIKLRQQLAQVPCLPTYLDAVERNFSCKSINKGCI